MADLGGVNTCVHSPNAPPKKKFQGARSSTTTQSKAQYMGGHSTAKKNQKGPDQEVKRRFTFA